MKYSLILLTLSLCIQLHAQKNDFQLCGDGKTYPYYSPDLKYAGDLYAIIDVFVKKYNSARFKNKKANSGILTIQFHVNCTGESGNFTMQSSDFNYVTITLNKKMTKEIMEITQSLKDWIPAQDENQLKVNSHKFLSFKIINGQIVDILPK